MTSAPDPALTATPATAGKDEPRRRPRDRKQQILLAARDLFVQRGYPNVSMALIAESVGITAGGLYRHFDNKAILLDEVITESFAYLDSPLELEDFEDAVTAALEQVHDRPHLADLWAHEVRYLSQDRRRQLRGRMLAYSRSLVPALRREQPGLDPEQQELLAWAAQSVLSCAGRRAIRISQQERLSAVRAALRAVAEASLVPLSGRRSEPPPRLRPGSMRERLLLAAFEQFGSNGYQDTSMDSIAAAADVTGPNLYSYFQSKADVLRAVYERGIHALWIALDAAMSRTADPAEALRLAVESYARLARSWASTIDDPTGEAALDEAMVAAQREYVREWVALLGAVLPGLGQREARLRVHIAFFLVSDLYRNPRVSFYQGFQENLALIMLAVLFDGQLPSRG